MELSYINFEDNIVKTIETKAFNNLKNLKWIYLRGNRIEIIESDAFVNLPELETLDLAFNKLKVFDFATIDTVSNSNFHKFAENCPLLMNLRTMFSQNIVFFF